MGADFNEKAYEEIYKHPQWAKTADEYEEQFAAKLYKTSYVQNAAKTALTRLSRMLNSYYKQDSGNAGEQMETAGAMADMVSEITGERAPQNETAEESREQPVEITDILEEALLPEKDSSTGAGQIGKKSLLLNESSSENDIKRAHETDQRNLDAVINGDGNLRERMTMLYNGMFVNGGRGKDQIAKSRSLKNMLAYISPEQIASNPELGGIRYDLLHDMSQRKKHEDVLSTYSIARDLKRNSDALEGKGNAVTRFFAGLSRAWNAAVSSKFTRRTKKKEEQEGLGAAHYRRLGLNLSQREEINGMTGLGAGRKLQWKEGAAIYEMKDKISAEGMLQTAGPSGTSLRMLAAYKLMGASPKELLEFRLALIAWMVSSKDHSLFEVLKGAHNAGVAGDEDLSEPAKMYTSVDPIPLSVMREEFAPNKEFPHETVFKLMLNELQKKRIEKAEKRNLKRLKNSPDLRNKVSTVKSLEENLVQLDTMFEKIKEKRDRKGHALMEQCRIDEAQAYFVRMSSVMRVFDGQREYVKKEIEARKKELRESGYELPEDDAYTLYSQNTEGALKNVGKDATKADAQDLALNIYTTGAYLSITRGQKYGALMGKGALSDKRADQYFQDKPGSYEYSSSVEMKDGDMKDDIFKLVRISSRMSQDALEERGQLEQEVEQVTEERETPRRRTANRESENQNGKRAYVGKAYRGGRLTGQLQARQGDTITTNSLLSSSKMIFQATGFYQNSRKNAGDKNSVFIEYDLKGKGSLDISDQSKYQYEAEVLIPASTKFKVVTGLRRVRLDYGNVYWAEDEASTKAEEALEKALKKANSSSEKNKDEQDDMEFPAYGYAIRLEEVSGPGSEKRERTGTAAEMREQIRREYLETLRNRRSAAQ